MKTKITLLFATLFASSALFATPNIDKAALQNFDWQNITLSQQQETALNANQAKQFISSVAGTESAVAGYKIPANQGTVKVTISSLVVDNNHIFVPNVVVLDSNMNPSVTYPSSTFKFSQARTLNDPQLSAELSLTPTSNQDFLYLLIYTTKKDLEQTSTVEHPAKQLAKAKGNQPPAINDLSIKHTNSGKIKIDVDGVQSTQFIGLNGPIFEKKQSQPAVVGEKTTKTVASSQPKLTQPIEQSTESYFNNAVAKALQNNNIDKAMNLVNEAEKLGLKQPRELFLKKVSAKK